MSDHQILVAHTILLLALAALVALTVRNTQGELRILHDRLGTLERGGLVPPVPVQGAEDEVQPS